MTRKSCNIMGWVHFMKKLMMAVKCEFTHLTEDFFTTKGLSFGINWPYSGTMVSTEHYHKNRNVLSIMIEINRKLHLVEDTNLKSDYYESIKNLISEYLTLIRDHIWL